MNIIERLKKLLLDLWHRAMRHEEKKVASKPTLFDSSVFEKTADSFRKLAETIRSLGRRPRHESVRMSKHGGSNNHNQSVPKYRVKMARESNRINRTRFKHWTH